MGYASFSGAMAAGRFGGDVALQDGQKLRFDERYVRESILEPAKRLATGFQPLMPSYQGQVTDILIHAREVESLKRRLNEIYVHHTGRDYKTIEEALERDNFFTSEAALAFGLIDKVLQSRDEVDGGLFEGKAS